MDEDSDAFDDASDIEDMIYDDGGDDSEDDAHGGTALATEDDAFSQDIAGKSRSKNYEVEYTCHAIEDLQRKQKEEVDHVAGMFVIKVSPKRTAQSSALPASLSHLFVTT